MPPKYQIIADELKRHIQTGKYAAALSLPTEFTLAEEYQVSRQTIRQALSILEREGLIDKRKGSGSYIRRDQQETVPPLRSVAVITHCISDYIFPGILREVENVLAQNGCVPLLFSTQNQVSTERRILENLLHMSVDGVLVEGTKSAMPNPNLDLYRVLMQQGVPLVFMNSSYSRLLGSVSVLDDNAGGGRMLVDYLVSRGHTRIAGVFKSDDIQGHARYLGYTQGLQHAGLTVEDSLAFWYSAEQRSALFYDGALEQKLRLWSLSGVTAVICQNDDIAGPLIACLQHLELQVPEDMAVVSFDNTRFSRCAPVSVTSLSHGGASVGRTAAEKLLKLMDGESVSSEQVPWTLVKRESG